MGEWKRDPDDKAERLLSLTLALLSSTYGFTKDELFGMVREYSFAREKAEKAKSSLETLNKLFERDKNTLKENGVALQSHILDADGDDNTQTRYFISRDKFVWPRNFKISAHQLQLLELANSVWARAAIFTETNRGMSKLRALGLAGNSVDLTSIAPRLTTHQPSFLPLSHAAEERKTVTFSYRKADDEQPLERKVDPWQLFQVGSQWLLIGWDHGRNARRTFLLKRILGPVKVSNDEFSPVSAEAIAEAKADLEALTIEQVATVRLTEGTAAWTFFDPQGAGTAEHSFNYMDLHLLAEELRELGEGVEVLAPAALSIAIAKGLEKVVEDHA